MTLSTLLASVLFAAVDSTLMLVLVILGIVALVCAIVYFIRRF